MILSTHSYGVYGRDLVYAVPDEESSTYVALTSVHNALFIAM